MGCSGHQKSESFKTQFYSQSYTNTRLNRIEVIEETKYQYIMICDFLSNMWGKQFKSQKTLTQYNRDVHIEDDIPCSLCDKTFRTKKHLANQKFNKRTEKESLQFDVISEWPWMQLSYHVSEQFECTEKESRWENCECCSTVGYIYMTSLHCVFTLSLSDVLSLLKKSMGGCFCCIDSDCSGPLCELVEAFGRGADNCSITARLLRPAHLFRPFLRRVLGPRQFFGFSAKF